MCEVFFLRLNDTTFSARDVAATRFVSGKKRARIEKMRSEAGKKACLYSDLLVRCSACRKSGLSNSKLMFSKNEFGKPFLMNDIGIRYNVSHTQDAVVVCTSENEVGIDIEKIKSVNVEIAKRFFTANECEYVFAGDVQSRFLEIWTKKESYVKFIGKGLSVSLSSFDVLSGGVPVMVTMSIEGYIISVCTETAPSPRIVHVSEQKLLDDAWSVLI